MIARAAPRIPVCSVTTQPDASTSATASEDDGHAENEAAGDEHGGGHAVPAAFGPRVIVEHTFPEPGLYKLWAQFSQDGEVITIPFVVDVR